MFFAGGSLFVLLALPCVLSIQSQSRRRHGRRRAHATVDASHTGMCLLDIESERVASGHCTFISQTLCQEPSPLKDPVLSAEVDTCLGRRGTCALVGSSANLLSEEFGPIIDGHDTVIRINGAPTGKASPEFLANVGARSDIRFVNQFGLAPEGEMGCLFLHEPAIPSDCGSGCWLDAKQCSNLKCDVKNMKCQGNAQQERVSSWGNRTVLLDHLHGDVALRVLATREPTAGMKALMYSLHRCSKVSVFGFGPSCDGKTGARYYDNHGAATTEHNYDYELDLLSNLSSMPGVSGNAELKSWSSAESVRLYTPSCLDDTDYTLHMSSLLRALVT